MSSFVNALAAIVMAVLFLYGCKKEEDVQPAPTVAWTQTTMEAAAGQLITIGASVSAPAGLKTVTVTRNGAAFDSKTYTTETTAAYSASYTVPKTQPLGSQLVFTIVAQDNMSRLSQTSTLVVTITPKPVITVTGSITTNTTWTNDKIYKLSGFVRVGADQTITGSPSATAVLTIQPGTIILGERSTHGTLVVQRGSRLMAEGTADAPIIFTSEREPGLREPGDWGGVVLCGRSTFNQDGWGELEGNYGAFAGGGPSPVLADNSGTLRYVRIEYAGYTISPNAEINGLTLGAVGSGTTLEYVEVSYSGDDAFEWFGGTVNSKYLVAYRSIDDDFDTDNGYTGYSQFGLGIRGSMLADGSGSNGFESDNNAAGSSALPVTAGVFANYSLIGPKADANTAINVQFNNGIHLRRNTRLKVYNTFVTGYPNGLYVDPADGGSTLTNALNGTVLLNGVVLAGIQNWGSNGFGLGAATSPRGYPVRNVTLSATETPYNIGLQTPTQWFLAQTGNKILADNLTTGVTPASIVTGRPLLTVASAGTLLSGSATLPTNAFLTTAAYIGAFGATTDWTTGWTEFNPQVQAYR